MLGMGEDGHTASLFPGHALLEENDKLIAYLSDSPKPPPSRVTFTFPLIQASKHVAFVAAGSGKQDPMSWILKENKEGIPAGKVMELRNGNVVWFLDKAAASKL